MFTDVTEVQITRNRLEFGELRVNECPEYSEEAKNILSIVNGENNYTRWQETVPFYAAYSNDMTERIKEEIEYIKESQISDVEKAQRIGNLITLSVLDLNFTFYNGQKDIEEKYTNLKKVIGTLVESKQAHLLMLFNPEQAYFTIGHSIRVMGFVMNYISKFYDFENYTEEEMALGALMHDVGKMKLYSLISSKEKLTEEEFREIRLHPIFGYYILQQIGEKSPRVLGAVFNHHRRVNGEGYPCRDEGKIVPDKFAYLLGLIDSLEAMTCPNRLYRDSQSLCLAMLNLKEDAKAGKYPMDIYVNLVKSIPIIKES